MSKYKNIKLNKKLFLILCSISLGVICLITIFFLAFFLQTKSYDIKTIENEILHNYTELELDKLDKIDVLSNFGINQVEIKEYVFLGNYDAEFSNLIIVINDDNIDDYYKRLSSFLESREYNCNDEDSCKLYKNAILNKEKKSLYLVLGSKKNELEQIITYNYK